MARILQLLSQQFPPKMCANLEERCNVNPGRQLPLGGDNVRCSDGGNFMSLQTALLDLTAESTSSTPSFLTAANATPRLKGIRDTGDLQQVFILLSYLERVRGSAS